MPAIICLFAGMARSYNCRWIFAGSTRKEYAVIVKG